MYKCQKCGKEIFVFKGIRIEKEFTLLILECMNPMCQNDILHGEQMVQIKYFSLELFNDLCPECQKFDLIIRKDAGLIHYKCKSCGWEETKKNMR
jgi:transposase-like protein